MGRTAGTLNKITAEVKEKLESLIDGVVGLLDISVWTRTKGFAIDFYSYCIADLPLSILNYWCPYLHY